MPEYLSGKRKKLSVGIKSYSENTDTVRIIGNVGITSGKLGLGVTNPQSTLHISSGNDGDAVIILESDISDINDVNNPRIVFRQDGGKDWSAIGLDNNTLDIANSTLTNGGIRFLTNNGTSYTDAIERVRISSSGNVGIGTTVNFGKLDVVGNVIVSGRIGVNTTTPTQDIDIQTLRIRENLYDYYNSPGVFGYFLVKDNEGIKWVAVPPVNSNAIFASNNNVFVGVSSFIGINVVSPDNILSVSTNPSNSNFADIVYSPLWLKSGDSGIYTTKNVGIGTTIPLADFQVGIGTTGVIIDGTSGIITAIGYNGYFATLNSAIVGISTVSSTLINVGLGSTHVSAYLATAGGITTTGGDLYVGGELYAGNIEIVTLDTQNLRVNGIATINNAIINSLTANTGTITTFNTTTLVATAGTISNFVSTASTIGRIDVDNGTVDYLVGVAGTFNTLFSNSGVITSISGTSANYINIVGSAATFTKLDVDSLTLQSLKVNGISTLGNVKVESGIVTAVSGIVTYYGRFVGEVEGYVSNAGLATVALYANLAGVSTYANLAGVATYATVAGVSTYANVAGVSTYANVTGLATYANIAGLATYANVSGYSTSSGIATYASVAGISTYANVAGLATYATVTGVATYANVAGLATYAANAGVATYANITGVATYSTTSGYSTSSGIASLASGLTGVPNLNVGIVTATEYYGVFKGSIDSGVPIGDAYYATIAGLATAATKLQNSRTFEITGDIVASPISFDGTGNVSLAATIQPNSVGLGTDTFGDYVKSLSGTANQITVTGGTGEGSTPVISIPTDPILPGNVTVSGDLQVNSDLNVGGNITIGGTTAVIFVNEFIVKDKQIVLGFTTNAQGQEVSSDITANGGGISIASTEGNPLVDFNIAGVHTYPNTYKDIIWVREGTLGAGTTDAWHFNYAVGIGSTQVPNGVRFAAGNVKITEKDIIDVRHINASGIITADQFYGTFNGAIGNITIQTAEYAKVAGVATYSSVSGVATYSSVAGISTYANVAGVATYTNNSGISSFALIAGIATYAETTGVSSYTAISGVATYATTAGIATNATNADVATYANVAGIATYSSLAGVSSYASIAGVATYAVISGYSSTAGIATFTISSGISSYSNSAGIATYAISSGIATYATLSGIATYASTAGIATLANNLSGTPNLNVGIVTATEYYGAFKGTIDTGVIIQSAVYAQTSGIATYATIAGYSTSSGIATVASGLTGTPNLNVGIVTATQYFGIFKGTIDTAVTAEYSNRSGIATYATIAGYSTSSGIATVASGLTGTPNLNVGIVTATDYYGVFRGTIASGVSLDYANRSGIATYATTAGIATYATTAGVATYATTAGVSTYATTAGVSTYATTAGIATYATTAGVATYATTAGIATYATTAGIATYATTAGIATYATTAGVSTYATTAGIATYATTAGVSTNVIGGIGSISSLTVSGISTIANVRITPVGTGATVGAVGVITYYGDGSQLSGVSGGLTITNDTTTNATRYVVFDDITSGTATNVGVSSTKLTFNPSTGTLSATVFTSLSDETQKTNVQPITNSLNLIKQLQGVRFNWIDNNQPSLGLIAQEVEQVVPEMVETGHDGLKRVNYSNLIGLLIEAIKEQQIRIEKLEERLNA